MSKIGKKPINLPEGVSVEVSGSTLKVNGPKGTLVRRVPESIGVNVKEGKVMVSSKSDTRESRSLFGTVRAIIFNMVYGVSQGWERELELVGTGYRAEVVGNTLVLTLGFSHPVKIEAPEGISFKVEKSLLTVTGADKELVGLTAAAIRAVRPPEPYKGKGIKYVAEVVRRKAGKAAKAVGAPSS
ncbi:MAG: 50S ribosomal protein L6 [Patescibacteria group bacterium]